MRFEELEYKQRQKLFKRVHKLLNIELFNGCLHDIPIDLCNINKALPDGSEDECSACFRLTDGANPQILFSLEFEDDISALQTQKEQKIMLVGVMLHEMIHQYCYENNIDDKNHSPAWQACAKEHGLIRVYEDGEPMHEELTLLPAFLAYNLQMR